MNNLEAIFFPQTIRSKARQIYESALSGKTSFNLHLEKIEEVSEFVVQVTKANYPDLNIPFHSRWNHFQSKKDRLFELQEKLASLSKIEQAKAKIDLVIVSVLLDAGAGKHWHYIEDDFSFSRSEGLAVASFYMFLHGNFCNDLSKNSCHVDAEKLLQFEKEALKKGFQVSHANPLEGFEGRFLLLKNLGKVLQRRSYSRVSDGFQKLLDTPTKKITATDILRTVQCEFGEIWPGRLTIDGQNLGDVWHYKPFGSRISMDSLVPFHKLSQWLSYSLIEPLIEAGLVVEGVHELTGLPEYRNGGLLIDSGLLTLKDPSMQKIKHKPESELVIEWRALTIILLDEIAKKMRKILNLTETELPLVKVLEGGTWWAGRKLAAKHRADGSPPLEIESDGTVF